MKFGKEIDFRQGMAGFKMNGLLHLSVYSLAIFFKNATN
jgi:hypothetical protein